MSGGDDLPAVVVSHPKSGRTWLRFLLAHALSPDEVRTLHDGAVAIPDADRSPWPLGVGVTHDPAWLDRAAAGVVLLRDPGEILVSFFFHATEHRAADRFVGTFPAFLESDLGVSNLARFLGDVSDRLDSGCTVVTYDDLLAEPHATVERVIEACGLTASSDRIEAAVELGSLESMRRIEANSPVNARFDVLRPNRNRIRAGKADRGAELLTDESRAAIRQTVRRELGGSAEALREHVPDDWAL